MNDFNCNVLALLALEFALLWPGKDGHVPRPRNFTVGDKLPPEDSLAKCRRAFLTLNNELNPLVVEACAPVLFCLSAKAAT